MGYTSIWKKLQAVSVHVDRERNVVGITVINERERRPVTLMLTVENAIKVQQTLAYLVPSDAQSNLAEVVKELTVTPEPKVEPAAKKPDAKVKKSIARTKRVEKYLALPPEPGSLRYRVLEQLKKKPGTDNEVGQRLGISGDVVRPRRGELVRAGFVRDSGKRKKASNGLEAIVWEVVKNA